MDTLADIMPDTASDPVVLHDGVLCLQRDSGTVALRVGPAPVTALVPGWRPVFGYTGFAPFTLLQFSNDAGDVALWIIDADGARLGGSLNELESAMRDALAAVAAPRVTQLMDAVLRQPALSLDPQSRAFLRLLDGFRRDIGALCAASALPPARRVVLDAVPDP